MFKKLIIVILLMGFLGIGCAHNWHTYSDKALIDNFNLLMARKSSDIATDILWTGGAMSIYHGKQRRAIKMELEKRGYVWEHGEWIKRKGENHEKH